MSRDTANSSVDFGAAVEPVGPAIVKPYGFSLRNRPIGLYVPSETKRCFKECFVVSFSLRFVGQVGDP